MFSKNGIPNDFFLIKKKQLDKIYMLISFYFTKKKKR